MTSPSRGESRTHRAAIREEDAIYSATGNGRVGFISADDIAAVAARALTDPDMPNGDMILTGPQALSYDDVAVSLGETLGRTITHPGSPSRRSRRATRPKAFRRSSATYWPVWTRASRLVQKIA